MDWGYMPICPEGGMKHVQIHDLWAAEHSSLCAQLTSELRASAVFSQMVLSLSRNDLPLCGKQGPLMCQHHSKPAVSSASLTHLCFLCHFAPRLPSCPKFSLGLVKKSAPHFLYALLCLGMELFSRLQTLYQDKEKKKDTFADMVLG